MEARAKTCKYCGEAVHNTTIICPHCGSQVASLKVECVNAASKHNPDAKSRLAAGIMGLVLGVYGVHNFYLGQKTKGIVHILLATVGVLFTFGLSLLASYIWAFIEAIQILANDINEDARGVPLKE